MCRILPPKKKSAPPVIPVVYDQADVINFVRRVGIGLVLDAACAVEAAQ